MATVTTEDVFKTIATDTGSAGKALTTLSTSINDCLKTLNAAASTTGTGASVVASGASSSTSLPPPPPQPQVITVYLLLNLEKADSTVITQCRMVNVAVNSLPEARKNQLWFNHTLKFTKDALGKITLDPTNTIAKGKATFLTYSSSSSSSSSSSTTTPKTNEAEITIQPAHIDNIIAALATVTGATPKIQPVYLQYAAAAASSAATTSSRTNPWSQVATATDKSKTIEITPDVDIGITDNIISYMLSFADETKYVKDALSLTFMDNKTNFIPDADTIYNINKVLDPIKITLLGGGKKKRQSRKSRKYTKKLSKGGKRSRKSRRF